MEELPTIIIEHEEQLPVVELNVPASAALGEPTREQMRASLPKTRSGEKLEEGARLWQAEAYSKWLGLEKKRMTVEAATGAGKTRLAITIMHNWLYENPNGVVVFIVPSKKLLMQTYQTVRVWGFTHGRVGGGFDEQAPNKQVYITTYYSLQKVASMKHLKNRPTLLVLDECHNAGAEGAAKKLANFQGDACLLLSATPNRSDGRCPMHIMNTTPEGSPCYGENCKVGIHYELKLIDGIEQSRNGDDTLDYTFHVVKIQMTQGEQIQYDDLTERISKLYHKCYKLAKETYGAVSSNLFDARNFTTGNYELTQTLRIFQALCNQRKRLMNEMEARFDVAQQIMIAETGNKGALFHESIFGIERLNGMSKNLGIRPHVYHSGITTLPPAVYETYPELNNAGFKRRLADYNKNADRELTRWTKSVSDVLLTCKSLTEGFNAPDLDYMVMLSGTNNVRRRIQTIGRVFRGAKHKNIWMICYDNDEAGDMKCFYNIIDKTGIPFDKIRFHHNGINQSHITVPQDIEGEYL